MYDTRNMDAIASALIELTGYLNSPRQDDVLLNEAGISLDRALFPLLVRLSAAPSMSVAQLADRVGRDPSTVSRQLAKLEQLRLIKRPLTNEDMRVREATITKAGQRAVTAITEARRRLLHQLVEDWSKEERDMFPKLAQKLADAMKAKHEEVRESQIHSGKSKKGRGL
jgi:DNA-binding MarR family transcriptional regulator